MKMYKLFYAAAATVFMSTFVTTSCGGGGGSSSPSFSSSKNMFDISKMENPEPNITTECYTDTGIFREGRAIANPCYVCHTTPNTPYINEVEDYNLTFVYDFPEEIKKMGNPWLNAIRPDLTLKDIPVPSDEEIKRWIKTDNWTEAYNSRGKGDFYYFPDVPPLYKIVNGSYQLRGEIVDGEGFIKDENGKYTGWRVFKWKPFPGFFPTNGRIDSTIIRLPEIFRTKNGKLDLDVYKKNLAIVECAVKGYRVGEICEGTEVGDITLPSTYEGDAKNISVITYQYPPGTEFAHPVYYLDPDNTISGKALRLKEMRYSKKLAYAPERPAKAGEEEEEGGRFFWDRGLVFNLSNNWLLGGYIEDRDGRLRPQSAQEMKFCISCHGGIGGTVDGTFTYWRKVPGADGWMEQDYNLMFKNIKDWNYRDYAGSFGPELEKIRQFIEGEYQLYFSMTDGGDHFRSNQEIRSRISTDPSKISFMRDINNNIIVNKSLINYLDREGYIKPELFLPSPQRALGIDKQYYRVVKAQAFIWGRDVFDRPFGLSSGGNSLEDLKNVNSTGVKEQGIWAVFNTFIDFVKNLLF